MAFTCGALMIDVHLNTVKLDKAMKRVPGRFRVAFRDAFDHIGRSFLKNFKQRRLQGPPGIKARPRGIFPRFMRRHILPMGDLNNMGIEIYTHSKIARMHEEGAIINARGGQRLAVPFSQEYRPEMYTGSGRLRARFKQPGAMKKVGIIKSKGKEFLAQFKKGTGEVKPIFVLKRRIKIDPRLGFYDTWHGMKRRQIEILNKASIKALERV